ncbi:MAG TPA: hypothetical protein VF960_11595 [Chloroflexota bacterium]
MGPLGFSRLSNEQILTLLREKPDIERVPGVTLVWVDDVGPSGDETVVAVYLDSRWREHVDLLPISIAGVPVIARIEDRRTMKIIETIDPRRQGGSWRDQSRKTG